MRAENTTQAMTNAEQARKRSNAAAEHGRARAVHYFRPEFPLLASTKHPAKKRTHVTTRNCNEVATIR